MQFIIDLFARILNMSITASVVVLIVVLARFLLKKAPKAFSYALWGVVLFRLLCPVSFSSSISLVPEVSTPVSVQLNETLPEFEFETPIDHQQDQIATGQTMPDDVYVKVSRSADPMQYLSLFWLLGAVVMLTYSVVSYTKLRRRLADSVQIKDNIYTASDVDSPFVIGLLRPRIYVPCDMTQKEQQFVIRHEQRHIRRLDHIVKLVSYFALCLHWFNPLVWLAFVLSGKDMEMSCDEAVIKELGEDIRADYSASLLSFTTGRRAISGMPLAFGEGDTSDRIKNLAGWHKPVPWIVAVAAVGCAILAVCLVSDPAGKGSDLPQVTSKVYSVEKVEYEADYYSYSMVAQQNTPSYAITSDHQLYSMREYSEDWTALGTLTEVELTKENFDKLLRSEQRWSFNETSSSFRRNNAKTWMLIYDDTVFDDSALYYVFQQKNGNIYLAYGYYNDSEKGDVYSDDTSIRWIYKLTDGVCADMGAVAISGNNSVPVSVLPFAADIETIKSSVHWLDIQFGDDLAPFRIYRDGKELSGIYMIYDAVSGESIDFFRPSGLSAQTYIFHDAKPGGSYIITLSTDMDESSGLLCFGARLGSSGETTSAIDTANNVDVVYESDYTWVGYSQEGYDKVATFSGCKEKYSEEFFDEHTLLVAYLLEQTWFSGLTDGSVLE